MLRAEFGSAHPLLDTAAAPCHQPAIQLSTSVPRSTNSAGAGFLGGGEHRRHDGHRRHHRLPPRDRAPRIASGSPSPCSAARQRSLHRAGYQRRAGPTETAPAGACAAGREQVRAEPPGERRRAHVPVSRHEQPARLQPSRAKLPEPPLPRRARQLSTTHSVAHAGAPPRAAARRGFAAAARRCTSSRLPSPLESYPAKQEHGHVRSL